MREQNLYTVQCSRSHNKHPKKKVFRDGDVKILCEEPSMILELREDTSEVL